MVMAVVKTFLESCQVNTEGLVGIITWSGWRMDSEAFGGSSLDNDGHLIENHSQNRRS